MTIGIAPKRARRRWLVLAFAGAMLMAVSAVTVVAYPPGLTPLSTTFDTANGDLTSNTYHDWNPTGSPSGNVGPVETITCPTSPGAGTNCGLDWIASGDDNSFTQGTKEDDTNVVISTGSIPPNKDDLSRFYINKEKVVGGTKDGHIFVYMAWERTNVLGSAHMDFEFNQNPVGVSPTSTGAVTLNRTVGDLLIDFDFGGSGAPVLTLHRWVLTDSPSTDCEAVSSGTGVLCWGKGTALGAGIAQASVNGADVTDNNPPGNPRTLSGSTVSKNTGDTVSSTFGEAAIDLTAANVFPPNSCFNLGDAWLKSRSSGSSFTSAMKDFVAPIPVSITNCGNVKIIKQTDPRGVSQNFDFTSTLAGSEIECSTDTTPAAFTLNDSGNSGKTAGSTDPAQNSSGNTETCTSVPSGTYTVNESASDPTGFAFKSLACTDTGGNSTSKSGRQATITVVGGGSTVCVYTNQQQLGAIEITKTSTKGGGALDGAHFQLCTNDGPYDASNPCVPAKTGSGNLTTTSGSVCVAGLPFGDYYVSETSAPTGYSIDDSSVHKLTINANTTCASATKVSQAFSDTPLSKIEVIFTSLAGAGVTNASIVCSDSTPAVVDPVSENGAADPAYDDTDETITNLVPGTYTCTVVVDP